MYLRPNYTWIIVLWNIYLYICDSISNSHAPDLCCFDIENSIDISNIFLYLLEVFLWDTDVVNSLEKEVPADCEDSSSEKDCYKDNQQWQEHILNFEPKNKSQKIPKKLNRLDNNQNKHRIEIQVLRVWFWVINLLDFCRVTIMCFFWTINFPDLTDKLTNLLGFLKFTVTTFFSLL